MSDFSKFGVPISGGQRNGILHPKQSYRFRVRFVNFGVNSASRELTQSIVSVTRPSLSQTDVPIHSYNSIAYIGGKHEWDSIEIVIRDDINSVIVAEIGSQLQKQINHIEQTSAVAGINYKFGLFIDALDGTNNDELESWELSGCFITNTAYPEGNYESSDAQTVALTIRYDNAIHYMGANDNGGLAKSVDPFVNFPSPTGGASVG